MAEMMGDRVTSDPTCYGGFGLWLHGYGKDYVAPAGTACVYGCGHVLTEAEAAQRERNAKAARR